MNPDAGSGPTTLMLAIFGASFILDIWIFLLLVRSTWSAHSSRRIGRVRARALVTKWRYMRQADIPPGGWVDSSRNLLRVGLREKIYDPCGSLFSRSSSVPLE